MPQGESRLIKYMLTSVSKSVRLQAHRHTYTDTLTEKKTDNSHTRIYVQVYMYE